MYQPHSQCDSPADEDALWRYMDLTRFMALLQRGSLFFCRADLFGDAFEGSLTQATVRERERLAPVDPYDEAYIPIPYRQMPRWTAINCWTHSRHESAAMWSLYCADGHGVAVRTTFASMRKALDECTQKVFVSRVKYVDYSDHLIPENHLLTPFLHKRLSFEHEHEVRAIIQNVPDVWDANRPSPFERLGGVHVPVAVASLIEAIHVSPAAPSWYMELVQQITMHYGLSAPVHQSSLDGDPIY